MTSRAWVTPLVLVAAIAGCRGDAPRMTSAFDGDAALDYVSQQMAFGPRIPGTQTAAKAGDWIEAEMRRRADTVIVQRWDHVTADGRKLPMRNIFAQFRPEATERVLYVTHWDTRPVSDAELDPVRRQLPVPGANDGGSGVGLLLALADALRKTPPTVGVDLLFVDGEDYGTFDGSGPNGYGTDVLIGSQYFAKNPPIAGYMPIFGILWDMIGDSDLRILQEPNSLAGAREVVSRVWETARALGYGSIFLDQQSTPITDDHIPLLQAGMRVIDVIDLEYPHHHRPTDTMDKISAKSLKAVGDVALALVTGRDE